MKLALTALTCVAFWVLAPDAVATDAPSAIHECKDANGNVVYQDEPCREATPPALAPREAAPPPSSKPSSRKPKAAPRAAPSAAARVVPPAVSMTPLPTAPERPVEAQWATPEKTLRTFVDAVRAGDRALVLSCLTSSALAELGPGAEALPLERLRETVGSFTGYVSEGDLGPFWSIRALRAGTRPKWIFFERTRSGAWKIGAI